MSINEKKTLGELLSDPRIRPIASDAITGMDLKREGLWDKSIEQLREEQFGGGLTHGFDRLFATADCGEWYYSLYSREDVEKDPTKAGVSLVWFPSKDPAASTRPYILLVPGGGFVNVWNLTEGWPVAAQFNDLGYHVFILTYRVIGEERLLDKNMEDFAQAIRFIREHAEKFCVNWDSYITCGFSAGGYLICLWNVLDKGYAAFGLPKPQASFPVYPVTSWKLCIRDNAFRPERSMRLYGCDIQTASTMCYEIPEHAEGFPPSALFLAAEDTLVPPEHSRILEKALETLQIPCRLEIGPTGGHGFADGSFSCMKGWTKRAIEWYEGLEKK